MEPDVHVERIIAEQIAYYEARAPEYDDWWDRRNRYDAGPEFATAWAEDIGELRSWLSGVAPRGHVLEIAAGTGNWTSELVRYAERVTALDASNEALAICATKIGKAAVEFEVADVFRWAPPGRYDAIFSSFWISHIPLSRWSDFWSLLARSISPGGQVLFIDNAHPAYAAAHGPPTWRQAAGYRSAQEAASGTRRLRQLQDGSTYTVEKHYWTPSQLAESLADLGWRTIIGQTRFAFLFGIAERAPD